VLTASVLLRSEVSSQPTVSHKAYSEGFGLILLTLALLFNAILLAPEARIERVPVNDLPFHVAAAQRLGEAIVHRETFLDPWLSEFSLGFPLWRYISHCPIYSRLP
jgi:hypothetical protein